MMDDVANWLERLGLGQYAQRFVENDINLAILRYLTDQDLKELGVHSDPFYQFSARPPFHTAKTFSGHEGDIIRSLGRLE